MKTWKQALALGLSLSLFGGCASRASESGPAAISEQEQPQSTVSGTENESVHEDAAKDMGMLLITDQPGDFAGPVEGDTSPEVHWMNAGGMAICYFYNNAAAAYSGIRLPPPEKATLLQLARTTDALSGWYGSDEPLLVNALRQEKSMVILDLNEERVRQCAEAFGDDGRSMLNSLGRTILENHKGVDAVGFTMDGGQFVQGDIVLEDDGYGRYEPPKLYEKVSDEEYRALRESIPYPGLDLEFSWLGTDSLAFLPQDDPRPEIAPLLLAAATPGTDFESPDQLPEKLKLKRTLEALPILLAANEGDHAYPDLIPIAEAIQDSSMVLREHVEQAAAQLYGPETKVIHQRIPSGKWTWHARQGVYTPPHMGSGGCMVPYLLEVTESASGYDIVAAFVNFGMGGYLDEVGNSVEYAPSGEEMGAFRGVESQESFRSLVTQKLPRYRMTVEKNENGGFYLTSMELISS